MVAEETWGGVIDLEAFGKDGKKEPEVTARMRRMVREEEPVLWEMMTLGGTDGLVGRLMGDPMYAVALARGGRRSAVRCGGRGWGRAARMGWGGGGGGRR